jgi:NAD(P)-dependent dehydrogenase (short-subunit alcohol dehydrogenase family)
MIIDSNTAAVVTGAKAAVFDLNEAQGEEVARAIGGQVIYGSTKADVNGLVLPMARDLSDLGIRVNSIMPGIFATPLMLGAVQGAGEPGRFGAFPQAPGQARGVRQPGAGDGAQQLLQRAVRAPGWRHPHGAALTDLQPVGGPASVSCRVTLDSASMARLNRSSPMSFSTRL